jgi:hypothetical protein
MRRGFFSARRRNLLIVFDMMSQVLCPPVYPELNMGTVDNICRLVSA